MDYRHITHESIPPFINKESKILILGSLPSFASREAGFFYAHPQNRFFKILAGVFDEELPLTREERKDFLRKHKIALYDVIYECDIVGSSDQSIKNAKPINLNDLLLCYPNIKAIFTTGNKAKELFDKYLQKETDIKVIGLPSSSAANAKMGLEELIETYKIIKIEQCQSGTFLLCF